MRKIVIPMRRKGLVMRKTGLLMRKKRASNAQTYRHAAAKGGLLLCFITLRPRVE